jgi:succinoglycan biosynthesis transport protein ExoP
MMDVSKHRAPMEFSMREGHSLLGAHARWIVAVTLATFASACLLSWALHDTEYRSEVQVVVDVGLTPGGAPVTPDMETERQVASSGVVASDASDSAGTSARYLQQRLTVTVPADSTVLVLQYRDTTAAAAHDRAEAIADAYAAYRAPQASILSPATMPRSASGPNYLLNGGAGLVLGLLLGVGSALLRDRLDDSVRGPRDLADRADLPVMATVGPTPAEGAHEARRIVILDAPDSPAAEAYRKVRVKIGRAARGRDRTTAVTLVTSAAGDDGAAEVGANTAVALALGGDKVLLVEGNLRTPRLRALFDVPADVGLGEVLAGKVPLSAALHTSRVDGLRLLPADSDPPAAPGDLFDERAVQTLLSEVPADVDHVVLQAPPVLAAAETSTMAGHADLVVLVATTGRTGRQDLGAAVMALRDSSARILGGVLREGARPERGQLWSRLRPQRDRVTVGPSREPHRDGDRVPGVQSEDPRGSGEAAVASGSPRPASDE